MQVEAVLAGSSYVDNVMLHADPFHSNTVALIAVNQAALEGWAKKAGVDYSDFADLCSKQEACKEVLDSLSKVREKKLLLTTPALSAALSLFIILIVCFWL